MENIYYLDRPKYGETIDPKATKEIKGHYEVFDNPKKFDGFLKEFREQIHKYYREKVVRWKKNLNPIQNESEDETEEGVQRKEMLVNKVPSNIRKQCKGRIGKDGYTIYQNQEDLIMDQTSQSHKVFKDRVERVKFFNFGKNFYNECTTNLEEEQYLQAMQQFDKAHTIPTSVLTTVRDNSLIL